MWEDVLFLNYLKFFMNKVQLQKKRYKSFNILVESPTVLVFKSSLSRLIFKGGSVTQFFHGLSSNKNCFKIILKLKVNFKIFFSFLKKFLLGLFGGWFVTMELVGRGFSIIANQKFIKLNIGFTHGVGILLPKNLYVFLAKDNKNKFFIYGNNFESVLNFAYFCRRIKKFNSYKGKGIKFDGEIILLKAGKKSQY